MNVVKSPRLLFILWKILSWFHWQLEQRLAALVVMTEQGQWRECMELLDKFCYLYSSQESFLCKDFTCNFLWKNLFFVFELGWLYDKRKYANEMLEKNKTKIKDKAQFNYQKFLFISIINFLHGLFCTIMIITVIIKSSLFYRLQRNFFAFIMINDYLWRKF